MKDFKIYILPVAEKFRPAMDRNIYPFRNKTSYGVEQDFLIYLRNHPELLTPKPLENSWHYLPIFWSNFYRLQEDPERVTSEVQDQVNLAIIDDKKTFTVCQYNPGPLVDIGKTVLFAASRKSKKGIDIPLLCDRHKVPDLCEKKFLASFVGVMWTHKIRKELMNRFARDTSIKIIEAKSNIQLFADIMSKTYIALCPRGTGGDSFRFYEAMEFGVVPLLIGDIDTRPFKQFINWDSISFYATSVEETKRILDRYRHDSDELIRRGARAKQVYENNLCYQKWCGYVLKELENIR